PAVAPSASGTPKVPSHLAWDVATRQLVASGDMARGEELAMSTCAGCHGEDGIALVPGFPNLAGQQTTALFKQLHDYRSGTRQGGQAEMMLGMVQGLEDQQLADLATFYSSRPVAPLVSPASISPGTLSLVRIGSPARALPSCDSCHSG